MYIYSYSTYNARRKGQGFLKPSSSYTTNIMRISPAIRIHRQLPLNINKGIKKNERGLKKERLSHDNQSSLTLNLIL
jgi:hypothetical protein